MAADVAAGSAFVNVLPNFGKFGQTMSKGISAPMVAAGGAVGGLVAKIETIPGSFGVAGKALDAFTDGALRNISSLGHTIHTKLALAAETAFAGLGVKMGVDLERGLREVNTLFGLTGKAAEDSFSEVNDQVLGLSNELGIAATTLTKGLYEALSSGVPRENAIDFLRVATKAAIGGVTDTETAVDGITTAINAFGMNIGDAEMVADSFFATVIGGKTTFKELALNFADVAPVAAAAGIAFTEINAAIATLTATGVRTPEATTQIRAAIQGLVKPSEEMDAIFQRLGHTNAETALRSKGLGFAITAVKDASGGSQGALMEMLGSIEAVSAANILAGEGADIFTKELQRQKDSAGASQGAFEEMEKSNARAFERLQTVWANFAIVIGQSLEPAIRLLTGALEIVSDLFTSLPKPVQQGAGALIFLTTALGPPVFMVWRLHAAWKALMPIMAAAKMGAVTGGLTGMANALKLAGQNTLTFKAAFIGMKGLGMAQTAANVTHLGGAFTALRGSVAVLAGPVGLVAGLAVAFGVLDSTLADVEGRLANLKKVADDKLFEEFFEISSETTFFGDAKAFGLAAIGMGDDAKRAADQTEGAFKKILESGNIGLANRILIAAKGTGYEDALNAAFQEHARVVKETNAADAEGAALLAELTGAAEGAAGAVEELTDAQKQMDKVLTSAMDVASVYADELSRLNKDITDSAKKTADAARDAADQRLDALKAGLDREKEALDARHEAEVDNLAMIVEEGHEGIERRHKAEVSALDARAKAEIAAAEATVESEKKRAGAIEDAAERTTLTAAETKEAVKKRVLETKAYFGDLAVIAARGGGDIIDELLALGPDAADMISELADSSKPELDDFVTVIKSGSVEAVTEMRTQFEALPAALESVGKTAGIALRDALVKQLAAGEISVTAAVNVAYQPFLEGAGPLLPGQQRAPAPTPQYRTIPGFAGGGNVGAGDLVRVGERGEELVQFGASGRVIPNHMIGAAGGTRDVNITLPTVERADPQHIARAIAWVLP
jgi:TP901 family phage tail tape measure protein